MARNEGHQSSACPAPEAVRSRSGRAGILLRHTRWPLIVACLLVSCEEPRDEPGVPVLSGMTHEEFFLVDAVHRIEVTIDEAGVTSLLAEPFEVVQAEVTIDGSLFPLVGIRLKGGFGSFIPLDGDYPPGSQMGNGKPGKSALILDFNRYLTNQSCLGLEKLTLNNLAQDASGIHEFVGYTLFREVDVPASRVAYARVTINGVYKGLYAVLESNDNTIFLDHWYGTSSGTLYEGNDGVDLRASEAEGYDQDHGEDPSMEDVFELAAALDEVLGAEQVMPAFERHFDVDEYLRFAAAEVYVGHWDGYVWSINNYKIHHEPTADLWTFLPWGTDQLFESRMGSYEGLMTHPGPTWDETRGRMHELCYWSPECRERLFEAFEHVLQTADDVDLHGVAEGARGRVESLLLVESAVYGDPAATVHALDDVMAYIEGRRTALEAWMPCLVGEPVDHDGDGRDGCTLDPDDFDPSR